MNKLVCFTFVAIALSGCSNNSKPVHEYTVREYVTEHQRVLDNATAHFKQARVGAAYQQESYQYVLGNRKGIELRDNPPVSESIYGFIMSPEEALLNGSNTLGSANQSYSIYEMKRWQRFCGAGKISERDFDYIAKIGRSNVPSELKQDCTPPGFTRQDYLAAWAPGCSNNNLSTGQKIIRKQTTPPKGICG